MVAVARPLPASSSGTSRTAPDGAVTRTGIGDGLEAAPTDLDAVAARRRPQVLGLEVGLLHQPMRHAAQQFGLRSAALEAARPQPHVVGHELGHPPAVDLIEQQDGPSLGALHQHRPPLGLDVDLAEPAAPERCFVARAGARKRRGHRVAAADIAKPRAETALEDLAGGTRRQDEAQRRAEQTVGTGEGGAGGGQQRAALLDVFGDVAEIRQRHHARAGDSGRR